MAGRLGAAPLLAAISVAATCALAVAACASDPPPSDPHEFDDVVELLEQSFIDQELISPEAIDRAAVQGVLDYIGDPYTTYLTPERAEEFNRSLEGAHVDFEGIGASVTQRNGQLIILGPLPGSPADQAGILPGDVVLQVDGESIDGLTLEETVAKIRGPKGTAVVLTLSRGGASLPFDVTVVRDTISVSSVLPHLESEGVGYIRLTTFDGTAGENVRTAIAELRDDGAEGLILDLRRNGGGLVTAAVDIVSEFVEEGEVLRWVNAAGEETIETVTGEGTAYDLPLVVIVDGFSASASEVVSGALQDHERAVVVGTTTYGKGSVNLLHTLDSGAGLYVTIARWLTPSGRQIEGSGITPDVQAGENLDVQALGRIGELRRPLCDAYETDGDGLGGQDRLIEALEALCNIEPGEITSPDSDEQLEVAIAELMRLMGR